MEDGGDRNHVQLFYTSGKTAALTMKEEERDMKVLGKGVIHSALHF